MAIVEYPNEILSFLLGVIAILSVIVTAFRWKIVQIQNDTTRRVTTTNDTSENHKDINQLKENKISMEITLGDLSTRVARLEGAFEQLNKESNK